MDGRIKELGSAIFALPIKTSPMAWTSHIHATFPPSNVILLCRTGEQRGCSLTFDQQSRAERPRVQPCRLGSSAYFPAKADVRSATVVIWFVSGVFIGLRRYNETAEDQPLEIVIGNLDYDPEKKLGLVLVQ